MVVKAATKKKLIDLGFPQGAAHALADDRKWDAVKMLTFEEVYALTWIYFVNKDGVWFGEWDLSLNEMKSSKKRLYDIMQNAKEILLKRYSLQSHYDFKKFGEVFIEEEEDIRLANLMQINRIDSWWKVTTKENLIALGILPSHPFINWTKSFPFK